MFHPQPTAAGLATRFARDSRASVAISSALALPVLLGVAGLAIEFGDALVTRAETQRIADLAAHAGILAYDQSADLANATQTVRNIASLNGVAPDGVVVQLDIASGAGPELRVTLTTPRPLILSRLIAGRSVLNVTAHATATLDQEEPACILALDPDGPGIIMDGSASITAEDCALASNATVTLRGGSRIVTETLSYDSDTAPQISGGATLVAPDGGNSRFVRAASPDPLADRAAIALARTRLEQVATLQPVAQAAVAPGPDIEFGWSSGTTEQQAEAIGCTASLSKRVWSLDCPSGGTIELGSVTIGGGLSLDFATAGSPDTNYVFSGSIRNTGNAMRFGPGSYHVAGGIRTEGASTTLFQGGSITLGRSASACDGAQGYSICNMATLQISGPIALALQGGIRNTGGASLTLGTGGANSFRIGPANNGDALTLDGGSITTLADANGPDAVFEIVGNIRSGGGSCLSVGAAPNHDIAGHLNLSGGVTFGSGTYTIDGFLHVGAVFGGSVRCQGQNVSLNAMDATFVLSGKGAPNQNQNCHGAAAFCAGSGYRSMQLTAPGAGPFANLSVIGPLSPSIPAGASFGGGAGGSRISGAFYFPNGPITLAGGASAGGDCLQIIGASVSMSGGTTTATECVSQGASGRSRVRLIE